MDSNFWKNKKVLLTGHTGFKGSWLSLWLQKLDVDLIGYSKSVPTKPSLFELANVEERMTSVMGDVIDLQHITDIIEKHNPDIVIHMAAQSLVYKSYADPIETFQTNVIGTANILEADVLLVGGGGGGGGRIGGGGAGGGVLYFENITITSEIKLNLFSFILYK